ncbi:MAG: aldehyde dehydrogenase family protein [Candidatus Muirbacterium halophilum]|nr:aldehyde dehydrogenase family protein [Candidatus Muirbacterium halophilum]MCK9474302.1 aldehyde dehydrogenase family protein [Candidatus Muirbacterium halophilum]
MIIDVDFLENLNLLKSNNKKLYNTDINTIITILNKVKKLWEDENSFYYKTSLEKLPDILGMPKNMVKQGLEVVKELLDYENIRFNLKKSIDNIEYLNEFQYKFDNQTYIRFRPLGVIAHISASNVFLSCVDSVVSGIITKNSNILKMPRKDRFFPELFLKSIIECDKDEIISSNIQLWDFRGGNLEVENILKNNCDGIVVWGGEEAVNSYRKDLSLHTKLIEYGPKYSFSIIFSEDDIEKIAYNTAMDIIMWEQSACSSPLVVYVKKEFAERFADLLYQDMTLLNNEFPQNTHDIDLATEVLKFRELNTMESILGNGKVKSIKNTLSTIVLSDNNNFELTPQNRNIFIKSFEEDDDILDNVRNLNRYIQTVSIWADRDKLLSFSEQLCQYGVYRITSPGFMYRGKNGTPHDGSYPLRELGEFVHIENLNIDRFNEIFDYAKYNTEFYKDWDKNRLLTRDDCFKNSPPFSMNMISGDSLEGFIFSSGGTTGKPKFALYSPEDFDIMTDILADIYRIGGISKDDKVANTFIAGNLWTSFLVANEALKKIGCTNFPIAGNSDFEVIDKYLEEFKINVIVGLPSIIIRMAEICEEHNIKINIDTVLYGGEHFYQGARDYITKVWNVKRISSAGYALVDTGPVGYQCEHLSGGLHHVCKDFVKFELVDENDNVINSYDKPGEIVVTNINRFKMPIIRFKTGDSGKLVKINCKCGFKGKTFELLGRCDDVIIAGSTNVELGSFDKAVSEFSELSSIWQVIVDTSNKKDIVTLKIECKPEIIDNFDIKKLIDRIFFYSKNIKKTTEQGWLDFKIELVATGQIPRVERTGKVKKVLDKR